MSLEEKMEVLRRQETVTQFLLVLLSFFPNKMRIGEFESFLTKDFKESYNLEKMYVTYCELYDYTTNVLK